VGIDPERLGALGGFRLVGGGAADLAALGADDILLSDHAANELDARTGDVLTVFVEGVPAEVTVAGIVKDERASGALEFGPANVSTGIAATLAAVQAITGHDGEITTINVALRGGVRGSLGRAESAAARPNPLQQGKAARGGLWRGKPTQLGPRLL